MTLRRSNRITVGVPAVAAALVARSCSGIDAATTGRLRAVVGAPSPEDRRPVEEDT